MLRKIVAIKEVGRFANSALAPIPVFAKYNLIFGANGYGKSTLCAILRSLSANDPSIVVGRTRLGGNGSPQIDLLFDSGLVKFDKTQWSVPVAEILVFDNAFILENVHSGDAVELEQKRNLYRVIVGREGVALAIEEERLATEIRNTGGHIRVAEKALQSHVPNGITLEEFLTLPLDPEIDSKIASQIKSLSAVRAAAQLKTRPSVVEASLPALPTGLDELLNKTLDDIAADAQERIATHIKRHGMSDTGEAWLSRGVGYIVDDDCPFCGQSLRGLELVEGFRALFAETYRNLKASAAEMNETIARDFGDRIAGLLETLIETNRAAIEFWSQYCEFPKIPVTVESQKAIEAFRKAAANLLSRKLATPQEAIPMDEAFLAASDHYQTVLTAFDNYNAAISATKAVIEAKKTAVAAGDTKREEAALLRLKAQATRHDASVAPLCVEHQQLMKMKNDLEANKAGIRVRLEDHAKQVVKPYEVRINELLDTFNAGFRIAETKPGYAGGIASSTYQLIINRKGFNVGDGSTPIDRPSFKNTLSSGDRTTLALAFFLAHLERDPNRANRIVVFDDPFTSQDAFRRTRTVFEIRKIGAACAQVIVLGHDASFLRQIRDKCPAAERVAMQLVDYRDNGIKIALCDLDESCRGRVASELDDLHTYMTNGAGKDRDIIKKIRIVLETYCRATYSGSFEPSDMLGGIVTKIRAVGDSHSTWTIVDVLDEINEYSRSHHHGDDPGDGTADLIDPTELAGFVRRTLQLVNNLQA